ncbi:MAG TPA: hypothetical protein VJ110_00485 [Candidatus Nanoarchaeia archaeon]|nr:hypothetical protein [Candidatus Nanoarchaeia archaeon]
MAQGTAATVVKQKKKWFTVLSPEMFGGREIADVPAFAAEDLKGRSLEVAGQMLSGSPKDMNKKYILQVIELKGDKGVTLPKGFYITESFIQRSARKYKEKFVYVPTLEAKDKKKVKLKLYFFNTKKLHHSVRAALLRISEEQTKNFVADTDSVKMFDPLTVEKFTADLRKTLTQVYPIEKVLLVKIKLL